MTDWQLYCEQHNVKGPLLHRYAGRRVHLGPLPVKSNEEWKDKPTEEQEWFDFISEHEYCNNPMGLSLRWIG